jgi:REP-associated tyrosine transposase
MRPNQPFRKTCRRYNDPGHAHELTFSCYKRRPFLSRKRTCCYLADAIVRAREKHQFDVWAYVFMPEHAHLLIHPRNADYSISDILLSIKQSVSRRALIYLRKHKPEGLKWVETGQKDKPYMFWQDGGGYDRNMTNPETLAHALKYIHANPVRRNHVTTPEDWQWSSAKEWSGQGRGPVPVDRDSFPTT